MISVTYLIFLLTLLLALFAVIFALSINLTDFFGAPFIPTGSKYLKQLFTSLSAKNLSHFVEIGSGDGRVTRWVAAHNSECQAVGIEINPFLVLYSRLLSKVLHLSNVLFILSDFRHVNLSPATCIYIYMLPKVLPALLNQITKQCRRGTIIISQVFTLPGWEKYLIETLNYSGRLFYFYRLKFVK